MEIPREIQRTSPLELFRNKKTVKICAPMVRYSKLPFRSLVRKYNCDLAFTPMIIASSFIQSQKARDSEFTTNKEDHPLIVQFAARNGVDLADASALVYKYSDGVDINCGCPQRWAIQEGYGACLINKPELLADMIRQVRNKIGDDLFTVSVKLRIHKELKRTVVLCQQLEHTGASFIAVHGRTVDQRAQPVNLEAIRLVKDSVSVPVVANGDVCNMQDVERVVNMTGVDGVMSARGILNNPAMYAGYEYTPLQCVRDWVDLSLSLGTQYSCFHHHLMYMLKDVISQAERRVFNTLTSTSAVLDYLDDHYKVS